MVKYLNGTKSLCLTLTATDIVMIKWYVYAPYALHDDCHGHTRAIMTFGSGSITSFSQKQKMNAKSSTKAELIGIDDAISQILWTHYFLEHQGYHIISNTVIQDNKSTIIMETNGKTANSKHTKHMKLDFFITDKIKQKEIDIACYPTNLMWSDVLTKPLQGLKFWEMCAYLMDCPVDYHDALYSEHVLHSQLMGKCSSILPLQQCVGPPVYVTCSTNVCN